MSYNGHVKLNLEYYSKEELNERNESTTEVKSLCGDCESENLPIESEAGQRPKDLESQSKESFNDFEYWKRSISNIDSLLLVDPLNSNDFLEVHCDYDEYDYEVDYPSENKSKKSATNFDKTGCSSDELVNAYYARKCFSNAPICEFNCADTTSNGSGNGEEAKGAKYSEPSENDSRYELQEEANSKTEDLLASSASSSLNLITTTRFLHHAPHSPSNPSSSFSISPSAKKTTPKKELGQGSINLEPADAQIGSLSATYFSNNSMVSRIKNWLAPLKKPVQAKTTSPSLPSSPSISNPHQEVEETLSQLFTPKPSHNFGTSLLTNVANYNPPLSIDLIRRLKRPNNVPAALEYSNGQTFQGTVLEEWLMQSLDDYLANPLGMNHQNMVKQASESQANEDDFEKRDKSMSDSRMVTPVSSATTSVTSILIDNRLAKPTLEEPDEKTSFELKRLNSESYKAATQNISNAWIGDLGQTSASSYLGAVSVTKRQEANFFVQQILTDLIALGVLEFESGFENAINKTYKVT